MAKAHSARHTLSPRFVETATTPGLFADGVFFHRYKVSETEKTSFDVVDLILTRDKPDLVIVDTLSLLKKATDGSYGKEYDVMNDIMRMAHDAKTNLLLIHHTRKKQYGFEDDVGEAFLGSQALAAAVDNIVLLDRSEQFTRLRGKSRSTEDFETLMDRADGAYTAVEAHDAIAVRAPTQGLVMAAIKASGPLDYVQLAKTLPDQDIQVIKNTLSKLKRRGEIVVSGKNETGRSMYSLVTR